MAGAAGVRQLRCPGPAWAPGRIRSAPEGTGSDTLPPPPLWMNPEPETKW